MLFALGAFAAQGSLDIGVLTVSLFVAAVLGDSANYYIGRRLGDALLKSPRQRLFKPAHYQRAHEFYEKWGGKAIVLARFVPIVRTFCPFVAGVARMNYRKFIAYNISGGALWVGLFLGMGYALGNLAWVQEHFGIIVPVIIVISVLPIVWELAAARLRARNAKTASVLMQEGK
jgi:membrane-associated protein